MITVFGRLLASFFDAQAGPVPVSGRVFFTPNFTSEHMAEGLHLHTRLSAELDGEGSFEAPAAAGVVKPLRGRFAFGAYYAGTNAASASFGEVSPFSSALTDNQASGVFAYLARKWG